MTWIRDLLNKIFRNQRGGDYACSEWEFYKPNHLYEEVAPDNDFYENVYVAPDNAYEPLYHIYEDVEMRYIPMNVLPIRTWLEDNYGRLQVSSSILI